MFFFLKFKPSPSGQMAVASLPDGETLPAFPAPGTLYVQPGKQRLATYGVPGGSFMLLGDPVFTPGEALFRRIVPEPGRIRQEVLYEEVKGHYYWFYLPDTASQPLAIGNSFGAVYPVYYHRGIGETNVSSSSFTLAEKTDAGARDKRNLLERLLFNYPFFNSTWWEGIRLLEAHRYLALDGQGARVAGAFEVSDYFGTPEDTSRDSLPALADLFQRETQRFFPDAPFAVSLTGGFDGRTLVAAAKKAGRDFTAYSFGRPDSTDVTMPAAQAAELGVAYFPIYLDETYLEKESLASAWDFMERTEFNGNFGRPHYAYAARMLSQKTGYILTGNFGSELFRALHLPGVMMSESIIRVFAAPDDSWKDFLAQAARTWDREFFRQETDALIADIEAYTERMKNWEANHKFYHFVFNEIFRKYFGPELVMQSAYLNNRTPYLNLHFFKALNRTIWSGVHARLFEKVKSKRMKGQLFYATFIRRSDPKLYYLKTNKGYSPADVLESWRLPILATRVIWHKYIGNREIDDNSVHAFIDRYHPSLTERINDRSPFILSGLEAVQSRRSSERDIENQVKFYSIAAGWKSADSTSSSIL